MSNAGMEGAGLMADKCVVYARVSTKEQQDEGYSIPAQLKAIEAFCASQKLLICERFVEAESAGKSGRKQFGKMLDHLRANPDVRVVVAHKLDRLYRNFKDQITLEEELGARTRYVLGGEFEGPQGELVRDVQLSVSKFYLGNLAEEVRKGMDEKVSQGGWPNRAPLGYRNDRERRCVVLDPERAPLVRHAFERYATGLVSLKDLASELFDRGLRMRSGRKVYGSAVHKMLRNPFYCGIVRYKGQYYPGSHEPLISRELFDAVQEAFEPNRRCNRNAAKKHVFALRDFIVCGECGCKITTEKHGKYVYYRCTRGKGDCSQRTYVREEVLLDQVAEVLGKVELSSEIVSALIEECAVADEMDNALIDQERERVARQLDTIKRRQSDLLNLRLDGEIDDSLYRDKASELSHDRATFEMRLRELEDVPVETSPQVAALLDVASGARIAFERGDLELQRELLSTLLLNMTLRDGHIGSYQWKEPFGVLEHNSEGLFIHKWWALEDLNL